MTIAKTCPCGSGISYQDCCMPYLQKVNPAPTAAALMRSRYSAYVFNDMDYILDTWHPSTRPDSISSDNARWLGLTILSTQKGVQPHTDGTVEFIAHYEHDGRLGQLHEVSRFLYENDRWYYYDGELRQTTESSNRKIGRNDPCPCGSGLKYKKCCGSR